MRKTISIILMSAIIGTTVASTPVSLFAVETPPPATPPVVPPKDKMKDPWEEGKEDGEKRGKSEGEIKGKKDALDNKTFDWEKAFKGLGDIDKKFSIGRAGKYSEGFKVGFATGFENGYGEGYMKASIEEYEATVIESIAEKMGKQDASSDYYNKLELDENRHRLTDSEIVERFLVTGGDRPGYEEIFLVIYRIKYEDTYRKEYRKLRADNFATDRKGYENGKEVGTGIGEHMGKVSFVTPKGKNDWESAIARFETPNSIEKIYFLDRETSEYRESFVIGFREAFKAEYNKIYRDLNKDIAMNNINYENVAMIGAELVFKPSDGVGNAGGTLSIPEGTVYQETHIGISMDRDSFNTNNRKSYYTPVNHVYNIVVGNLGSVVKTNKPMTLKLDYFGPERAGIYQLVNNNWRYVPTRISDGFLETEIPAGTLRSAKYAIFIDEAYKPIADIKVHWAKEELYTFLRREYISGDAKEMYYPNANISRGDFVDLLGKVMGWSYGSLYDNTGRFTDGGKFGKYKDAINYASSLGYINGYTDGRFGVDDKITYKQVEIILQRVLYNGDFKWDHIQESIKTDKYTTPASDKDKNSPAKKGEAVYMLYNLQLEMSL